MALLLINFDLVTLKGSAILVCADELDCFTSSSGLMGEFSCISDLGARGCTISGAELLDGPSESMIDATSVGLGFIWISGVWLEFLVCLKLEI